MASMPRLSVVALGILSLLGVFEIYIVLFPIAKLNTLFNLQQKFSSRFKPATFDKTL